MRTIERTSQFKRDYKREKKGRYQKRLDRALIKIVELLANDEPLAERNHDHALSGDWNDCRDCHIWPDLFDLQQTR